MRCLYVIMAVFAIVSMASGANKTVPTMSGEFVFSFLGCDGVSGDRDCQTLQGPGELTNWRTGVVRYSAKSEVARFDCANSETVMIKGTSVLRISPLATGGPSCFTSKLDMDAFPGFQATPNATYAGTFSGLDMFKDNTQHCSWQFTANSSTLANWSPYGGMHFTVTEFSMQAFGTDPSIEATCPPGFKVVADPHPPMMNGDSLWGLTTSLCTRPTLVKQ